MSGDISLSSVTVLLVAAIFLSALCIAAGLCDVASAIREWGKQVDRHE
jgi:hypothetical protein